MQTTVREQIAREDVYRPFPVYYHVHGAFQSGVVKSLHLGELVHPGCAIKIIVISLLIAKFIARTCPRAQDTPRRRGMCVNRPPRFCHARIWVRLNPHRLTNLFSERNGISAQKSQGAIED